MIDTGLIDPLGQVGFELPPEMFDRLLESNSLRDVTTRSRRDASGRKSQMYVGAADVRLAEPDTKTPVSSVIHVSVARGVNGLPARAGLTFFHALPDGRVHWDCSGQTWTMELT